LPEADVSGTPLLRVTAAIVTSRRAARRVAFGLVAVATIATFATAESANAIPPVPAGPLIDLATGGLGGAAVDGFGALLRALFEWPAKVINTQLLAWLVSVPDYAVAPSTVRGTAGSNLQELASTTSAMAFAGLAGVGTVAGVRYWAAGLSGSGGFQALEGLARIVGAAMLIVLWPWLFRRAADLSNAAGRGLLASDSVLDDTSKLLALAFAAAVTLNFFSLVIACGAGLLFLGLLVCKVVVNASTALLYVAMPLPLLM
jgi:hypothetical protein